MRVDVSVDHHRRIEVVNQRREAFEPSMWPILGVADTAGGAVGEQHIHARPAAGKPRLPGVSPGERASASALLALGPLVGTRVVSDGTAEAGDPQTGDGHDASVGVDCAGRPWPLRRHPCPHPTGSLVRISGQIGVVVAGNEHARRIQLIGQVLQIRKRQIACAEDHVDSE